LRAGLALALPRLELFLRVATRFFALVMVVTCEYAAGKPSLGFRFRTIRDIELYTYCAQPPGGEMI
jgi:hypothetical protein